MSASNMYEICGIDADLKVYPLADPPHLNLIVIGDLHGNAMKALWILAFYGIVKLEHEQEDLDKLWAIYLTPIESLDLMKLDEFVSILEAAKVEKNVNIEVLFLGDMLADRGGNDLFMLFVLAMIYQKVAYQILLSNHDWEAIVHYENPDAYEDLFTPKMPEHFTRSMLNRFILEEKYPGMLDFSKNAYNKYYLPFLKLYAYSKFSPKQNILYSHAPIISDLIEMHCQDVLKRSPANFDDIVQMVEVLNRRLMDYLKGASVFKLNEIILKIVWNRIYTDASRDLLARLNCLNVHGHDLPTQQETYFFSMDSAVGKPDCDQGLFYMFEAIRPELLVSPSLDVLPALKKR